MNIRDMEISDIPNVISLAKKESGFNVSEDTEAFWSDVQLRSWVRSGDVLLVAEEGDQIVGFVLSALHKPTGKVTWENQLVSKDYRGRGVAESLIEELEKRLKEKGATYLHFLVKEDNRAWKYYVRKSFRLGYKFFWFGKKL